MIESEQATPGQMIFHRTQGALYVHPLDRIGLSATSIDERLGRAMQWIVDRANRRFSFALAQVKKGQTDDLYEIHQAHLRQRGEPQS